MDILATDPRPQILSLGAGVQSTTMYLMAALGEITPKPDFAIFADTQDEPLHVYTHLADLQEQYGATIPIIRVTKGRLSDAIKRGIETSNTRFASIPGYLLAPNGDKGIGRRQCTREYKIDPINSYTWKKYRKLPLIMWIGISLDEATRMKPSRVKRVSNRWPLIEKRMTRHSCVRWLQSHGFAVPKKSACVYCPYHNNATWRELKTDPIIWQEVETMDALLRKWPSMRGEVFLHPDRKPIGEVDLTTPQDHGQQEFDMECEGYCGI